MISRKLLWSCLFYCIFLINSIKCSGYEYQSEYRTDPCKTCLNEVPVCDPDSPYRRIDGSCTNLQHPTWANTDNTFLRLIPNRYSDGISAPRKSTDGSDLPLVRQLRTSIFPNGEPSDPTRTLNLMQFGQFIAHDMTFLKLPDNRPRCCTADGKYASNPEKSCLAIKVPASDKPLGVSGIRCMNFTRTVTDLDLGCSIEGEPAKQINTVTSYLDLSNVYGTTDEIASQLRSYEGGKLKGEKRNGRYFPPADPLKQFSCPCNLPTETACYQTGDARGMSSPDLAILQVLFFREHNRIAKKLAKWNPSWDDEKLYNEARKINIAAYQYIVYNEWIPGILGKDSLYDEKILVDAGCGYANDYDSEVNPEISNEFSQSAFRYFHTAAMGALNKLNADRSVNSTIPLHVWLSRPSVLEQNKKSLRQLALGMVTQSCAKIDIFFTESLSDRLFTCRGNGFGRDLRAIDFQRDREHGLGYYNDYRSYCGIPEATCWDDYLDLIPEQALDELKEFYKSYKDVDVSVAAALENKLEGTGVGPTFFCLIADQFRRSRQGDRFFYEHEEAGFTLDQLAEIRKASISKIFCNNMHLNDIQLNSFFTFDDSNPITPCNGLTNMNLKKWKEDCKK